MGEIPRFSITPSICMLELDHLNLVQTFANFDKEEIRKELVAIKTKPVSHLSIG